MSTFIVDATDEGIAVNGGVVQVRFVKMVNGAKKYHRTAFAPGDNVDAQMANVNAHLAQMGESPVADWPAITAACEAAWTPEVIAAYQAAQAARAG